MNGTIQSQQIDPDLAVNYQSVPNTAQCLEISAACDRFWQKRGKSPLFGAFKLRFGTKSAQAKN